MTNTQQKSGIVGYFVEKVREEFSRSDKLKFLALCVTHDTSKTITTTKITPQH